MIALLIVLVISNKFYVENTGIKFVRTDKKKNNKQAKYLILNSKESLQSVFSNILRKGYCAIDTETNSLNIEKAKLVGFSLCYDESYSYYIPINHLSKKTSKKLEEQLDEDYVVEKLKLICENPSILKIGQNIKYDLRILNKYNISINSVADTMLMSYVLDNGIIKHNMDDLAFNHLQHNTIKFKDIVGSGKNKITFDYVELDTAVNYAAEDALITLRLYAFKPQLKS